MLPYFPFDSDTYTMTMGIQALSNQRLIEIDTHEYTREITFKRELLTFDLDHYFQALPSTLDLQWEALQTVLPNLAQQYPAHFSLNIRGKFWFWRNRLLGELYRFKPGDSSSLPYAPLDWLGRQVQEDLLLLHPGPDTEMLLLAGQLCFPNAWGLNDKLGKPFLTIHQEVPLFNTTLGRSSTLLLARLKADRPVWRVNWGVKPTPRLNLTPRFFDEVSEASRTITSQNAGELCYLRLERQVLIHLPLSQGILFTIHTYQEPLALTVQHQEHARRLFNTLTTTPPAMLEYKGITPFTTPLLAYLATKI